MQAKGALLQLSRAQQWGFRLTRHRCRLAGPCRLLGGLPTPERVSTSQQEAYGTLGWLRSYRTAQPLVTGAPLGALLPASRATLLITLEALTPQPSLPGPEVLLRRAYAKAGAAKGGAPAGAAGPKRPRTSSTKLYSVRNDRLRHTHEQIWPTMQLTEFELAMFKRNNRLFAVNMGKALSLKDKFQMSAFDPSAVTRDQGVSTTPGAAGTDPRTSLGRCWSCVDASATGGDEAQRPACRGPLRRLEDAGRTGG